MTVLCHLSLLIMTLARNVKELHLGHDLPIDIPLLNQCYHWTYPVVLLGLQDALLRSSIGNLENKRVCYLQALGQRRRTR